MNRLAACVLFLAFLAPPLLSDSLQIPTRPESAIAAAAVRPGLDPDGNGQTTIRDVFYLINHLFFAGSQPVGGAAGGDANLDTSVNVADVFYLLNYLFAGGAGGGDDVDDDGDGFTENQGDCCDVTAFCSSPALVNPAAFEIPGNQVDENCDGTAAATATSCDLGLASNASDALHYARAMDLCQTITESDTSGWGVISAALVLPSGTGTPHQDARAIRPDFGSGNTPLSGTAFSVLSTGNAAARNQTNPNFSAFQSTPLGTQSAFPADWYTANGSMIPAAPECPGPIGATAMDPIMLQLRIRVPTNARSFSVSANFFSAEYPEWVCSSYNDFFVVLLDSAFAGEPANPADKNIAVFTNANGRYPLGVNLAYNDRTRMFRECVNGRTGCAAGATPGTITSCTSTAGLVGTGFEVADPGNCDPNSLRGGGSSWLSVRGNVVPGEIIVLRFAIWDTSDALIDSLVLLDNFQWSTQPTTPGAFLPN